MAAPSPLSDGKQTNKDKGIAYFNDVFRDAVRGDNHPEKSKGFVTGDLSKIRLCVMELMRVEKSRSI